ncbi:MAG: hypothetical protein CSA47_01480 [Gammaproteobacteria bacterium]|nr:MAG: hypothetical protein CSA47_01480 [Gammaproteobacteria bacterium]
MSLYEFTNDGLEKIPLSTFQEKRIRERNDLQRLLKNDINVLSRDLLVVAEEFGDWEDSNRRIDLLAVDKKANIVVIELKRTIDGGHIELQAIRYAAMVSTMTFAQLCNTFENFLKTNGLDINAQERLLEFLEWEEADEEKFGNDVKIILASADFSKEVTTTVMWLNERGLDIKCFKLVPHDFNGRIIIDIQQIIPLPEAENFQIKVREKTQAARTSRLQKKQWNLDILLHTIKDNAGTQCSQIAKEIHAWSQGVMDRIWWSDAKIDGSFIPVCERQKKTHIFYAIRSTGKIELYLGNMAQKSPFDNVGLRQEFVNKLNKIGADIPENKLDKYPKFPLEVLSNPKSMNDFKAAIEWALTKVKEEDNSEISPQ